jgi:HK97 family phage prohead protease
MIAFIKEHGAYMQKDLSQVQLVDWFKDNSTPDGAVVEEIILYGSLDIKADDEGFPWTLSDMTLDRDMERIDPTGWDLKEFRKNPIVLWGHDSWTPAIGMMKNVKKSADEKGALTGTVVFDESGTDPLATMIAAKVRSGILTKGSVGFRTKKIEILDGARDGTRLIHREQELMEFSIVNIPSNPSAQVQRHAPAADPKNYVELLMQDNEGSETSAPGETSHIERLFENRPTVSGEDKNLEEIFNASN